MTHTSVFLLLVALTGLTAIGCSDETQSPGGGWPVTIPNVGSWFTLENYGADLSPGAGSDSILQFLTSQTFTVTEVVRDTAGGSTWVTITNNPQGGGTEEYLLYTPEGDIGIVTDDTTWLALRSRGTITRVEDSRPSGGTRRSSVTWTRELEMIITSYLTPRTGQLCGSTRLLSLTERETGGRLVPAISEEHSIHTAAGIGFPLLWKADLIEYDGNGGTTPESHYHFERRLVGYHLAQ